MDEELRRLLVAENFGRRTQRQQENVLQMAGCLDEDSTRLPTLVTFAAGEFVVNDGLASHGLRSQLGSPTAVPLGLILQGQIVVIEYGKAVKQLSDGDFIGLFEEAVHLTTGTTHRIGAWSLKAQTDTTVLFSGDVAPSSALGAYVVERARQDPAPKPLSDSALLDWFRANSHQELLNDTVVAVQSHLLPSNEPLFRHLASLVGYNNVFVLEKSYSTVPSVRRRLVESGLAVVSMDSGAASYDAYAYTSLGILWQRVFEHVVRQSIKRVCVVGDGGDLILTVPSMLLDVAAVVGVEQTRRGSVRVRNTCESIYVVDVGTSQAKIGIESEFIATGIIRKLTARLGGDLLSTTTFGIAGFGSIGSALFRRMQSMGLEAHSYDVSVASDGGAAVSLDSLVNECDVIIGCVGDDFLRGVALGEVTGSKIFVSTTSADVEFRSLLHLGERQKFEDVHVRVHDDLEVVILNGGYPINFDREVEWESPDDMQLTRTLMLAATFQALARSDGGLGVETLDEAVQTKIVAKFQEETGRVGNQASV